MKVLVAGGAGYIGSVCAECLLAAGYEVGVIDNLSRGHRDAVPPSAQFYLGDVGDSEFINRVLDVFRPEAVMHFCAHSLVGESVREPMPYYENNVAAGLVLLRAMLRHGVRKIVFSSTAAVFGEPEDVLIAEDTPKKPINPYGRSKLMFENILTDYSLAYGLKAVSLRYFNAAGATKERGEDHRPESHLIPIVLEVALGKRPELTVFGDDYPTPDGSCVRDYIHVEDLAQAHILALSALDNLPGHECFNLGNGHGFSVFEVIKAAERVTGKKIPYRVGERRLGDPAVLVASSEKIRSRLGWKPRFSNIDDIIESAWRWRIAHPSGYAA